MPVPATTLLSALAALALVLGLVLLAARAARASPFIRRTVTAPGRRMTLQDSLALDRQRRLQVVRCDGRDLLLLTGGNNDVVVGWLTTAEQGVPS